jgi:hypothetical protein
MLLFQGIDYLGQWNEMPASPDFILALRAALDAAGLQATGLVGSDRDWSLADAINNSTQLRDALVALGAHYPSSESTPAARQTGLPLWASEDFSDFNRGASHWGAQWCVRGCLSPPPPPPPSPRRSHHTHLPALSPVPPAGCAL